MCLGIPGRIVEIVDAEHGQAVADCDGARRELSVAMLGVGGDAGVTVGDWVDIHMGLAVAKVTEAEAQEAYEFLRAAEQGVYSPGRWR